MKRNLMRALVGLSAAVMVFVFADISNAQPRKARGKSYTKAQVERVIKRVEERTDNFKDNFDESLDNSNLDGTRREDNLMDRVKEFEKATDELRDDFDRRKRWIESRPQVRKVLNLARVINKTMKNRRLGKKTESNWVRLRYELNTLAKIYNLPRVNA